MAKNAKAQVSSTDIADLSDSLGWKSFLHFAAKTELLGPADLWSLYRTNRKTQQYMKAFFKYSFLLPRVEVYYGRLEMYEILVTIFGERYWICKAIGERPLDSIVVYRKEYKQCHGNMSVKYVCKPVSRAWYNRFVKIHRSLALRHA